MSTKMLVFGGTGFLGKHLVAAAQADGWQTVALGRSQCDIRNEDAVAGVFTKEEPSCVINCAAYGVDYRQQDLKEAVAINVYGAANIAKAAAKAQCPRLIHIGTSMEYGVTDKPCTEETALKPFSLYGSTKAAGSLVVSAEAKRQGLSCTVLRLFTLYGPGEGEHKFVGLVANACRSGEELSLTLGEQVRDYCYVEDVAGAIITVAGFSGDLAGEVFNVGSGKALTMKALGETISSVLGSDGKNLNWGGRPYRPDELWYSVADVQKIKDKFGWQATTSLADGLGKTL